MNKTEYVVTQTLHKVVDFLVKDSSEDVCQICKNLGSFPEVPDNEEPCPYKRAKGELACRNGVIAHFSSR